MFVDSAATAAVLVSMVDNHFRQRCFQLVHIATQLSFPASDLAVAVAIMVPAPFKLVLAVSDKEYWLPGVFPLNPSPEN